MAELKQEQLDIDLPATGDDIEVELEEQKSSEETKQEQPQEEVQQEQPQEEVQETTDKEVEEQATSVQKRIDKLTRKMREAERQREEALRYAKQIQEENQKIKQNAYQLDKGYVTESTNRIESQIEAVKEKLKAAVSAGDVDSQIQANELLARLAAENERYKVRQKQLADEEESYNEQSQQAQPAPSQQQEQVTPDPKAQKWLAKNTWFAESTAMRETALSIHSELVQEGFDVSSDEYYSEIDKRIREEFPHKFEDTKQVAQKPVQTVASANRTASNNGRKKVRLSPSQVAIAKKLGVPISEYAKYVKEQ